jgi:hypothetical protein
MNLFPVNFQFLETYKYGPRLNRLGCFYEDADEDGAVCIVPLHLKDEVFDAEREPSASVLFENISTVSSEALTVSADAKNVRRSVSLSQFVLPRSILPESFAAYLV